MPNRTIGTEYADQYEIERARLAQMLDDLMITVERAQRATREDRIELVYLDPLSVYELIEHVGGLKMLRRARKITKTVADHASPEVRAALV